MKGLIYSQRNWVAVLGIFHELKQCHAMNEYYLTGQRYSHTPILQIKGLLKLGQGELLTSNLRSLTTLPLAVSYSYSLSKLQLLLVAA